MRTVRRVALATTLVLAVAACTPARQRGRAASSTTAPSSLPIAPVTVTESSSPAHVAAGEAAAPSASPAARVVAMSSVAGVPVGWPDTEAGARAAAVGYVSALGTLFGLGMITQHDTVKAISTRAFGESLASSTVSQLDAILAISGREGRGRDGVLVVDSPVTAEVASVDVAAGRVVVRVWAVLVVAAVATAPAYEWWHTTTVTLVWERDDWRIDGWVFTPGPAPAPNPKASPARFDEIVPVGQWAPAYEVVAG